MRRRFYAAFLALFCVVGAAGCAPAQGTQPENHPSLAESIANYDEVVSAIRGGLREYSSRITVRFSCEENILDELSELTNEWVEAALRETDNPREGDYIRYQYGGYESVSRYEAENGNFAYTVEIVPDYYLYFAQEQEVTARLAEVYEELALSETASDEEKISAIYRYVCTHVQYDEIHRKNPYYHMKSTAYAALVNHRATCQGYCVLLYRMLRENGVDCRVVTGIGVDDGGEQLHAWNIVKLDGRWYNLDATWDAGGEEWRYFLRGAEGFENHTPGEAFATEQFLNTYPIAENDYAFLGNYA